MGKSILVTGGARSGKSRFAEDMLKTTSGQVLYLATALITDEEMAQRVEKHRSSRPGEWHTLEGYQNLGTAIREKGPHYSAILLDCVTIMVTNLLFDQPAMCKETFTTAQAEEAEREIMGEMTRLVAGIKAAPALVVMVTNELGSGIVPEYPISRVFRDIAGRVNQYLASQADEVYLTVSGLPLRLK